MEFFSELLQVSAVQWLRTGMAIALVLLIVFAGEAIYRFLPHGERFSRKFVHIGAGIAVAFLPYFGLNQVLTVSIGVFFTVANFVAIQLGLFQGIHNKKDTYGTVFFPIAFTFLCYYSWSEVWLITIPLIIMAVGDGIASLVGENVANKRILHPDIPGKTWQGSGAMFGIALATFAFYYLFVSATPIDLYLLLALPAGALLVTLSETVAWKGSDNISVPFFAWLVMRLIGTGMADMITFTLVLMLLFAWLTWRLRVLSTDGAIAVVLLGFFLLTIGGLGWIVPIVTFFVLSSALSKLPRRGREIKAAEKGARRDASQVAANGGLPFLLLLGQWLTGHHLFYDLHIIALAGATADTWATEIGSRYGAQRPLHLRLWRRVPAGTSGAVSLFGLLGSAAGGTVIGLVAMPWFALPWYFATLAGLVIAKIDSLLGAFVQRQYVCPKCGELVELPFHCASAIDDTHQNRFGWYLLDNNWINFLSMSSGMFIAAMLM
jgi:uncharacterized protein (TIGR00297 family)